MADSVKAFFDTLAPDASKASGLNATFQFDITGDDGGQWFAKISDGNVEIGAGTAENPTIVLTSTAANFLDLINGKINGQMAFLTGKLKIKGDMTLAMKLESLFKLG
jgi:putative sterol carrier protein